MLDFNLTSRQYEVLVALGGFCRQNHYCPTVRELCAIVGLSSPSTVFAHLRSLEQKGLVMSKADAARTHHLTEAAVEAFKNERFAIDV